ncbi:MAG TPA: DUF2171 domain-containing protein [Allosphingosinicella sp.]|uniref:DUF2171 domain-containing protein n=1 Tax=Allosphingosinicella sp. TaxID=2823234 RepID=UPI002EDA2967
MVDVRNVRQGMQVIGSDGGMVGEVAGLHGDHIHVRPTPPVESGVDHVVPRGWVVRVDQHVHLDREAALVRDTWTTGEPAHAAAPAAAAHHTERKRPDNYHGVGKSWIVWLIGIIFLAIVIILGVRGCGYAASDSDTRQPNVDAPDA